MDLAPLHGVKDLRGRPLSEFFTEAVGMKEPRKPPPKPRSQSEEKLDEQLEGSFPASDPPAKTTPTWAGGPARPRARRFPPAKPAGSG